MVHVFGRYNYLFLSTEINLKLRSMFWGQTIILSVVLLKLSQLLRNTIHGYNIDFM